MPRISKINMIGFSRGGALTVMIARDLYITGLGHIPVNIFGIDPVPGASHATKLEDGYLGTNFENVTLMPNVKNFVFTEAIDDKRVNFKPLSQYMKVVDSNVSNVCILPIPGTHTAISQAENISGKITASLVYKFLKKHGSTVHPENITNYSITDRDLLLMYDQLMWTTGNFKGATQPKKKYGMSLIKRASAGGYEGRRLNEHSDNCLFYNVHHENLFQKQYTAAYREIKNMFDGQGYRPFGSFFSGGHIRHLLQKVIENNSMSSLKGHKKQWNWNYEYLRNPVLPADHPRIEKNRMCAALNGLIGHE